MIDLNIPEQGIFILNYLECDANSTLTVDEVLFPGATSHIKKIQDQLKVYLIKVNTHRTQRNIELASGIDVRLLEKGMKAYKIGNSSTNQDQKIMSSLAREQ